MRLWLHGHSGKMGLAIKELLPREHDIDLVGVSGSTCCFDGIEKADVVIDFSTSSGSMKLLDALDHTSTRVLVCATGHTPQEVAKWKSWSENTESACVAFAPNTSLAIQVMARALESITQSLDSRYEIGIDEVHHKHKMDAPSGTAKYLHNRIVQAGSVSAININSMRGGGLIGEHSVRFMGEFDEIIVTHRAFDRRLFAQGAILLAKSLSKSSTYGLVSLEELLIT